MRILSVATHDERMYDIFKESCKRNKIHLDILGWGEKWQGFAWRWDLILDHLTTNQIPDKELSVQPTQWLISHQMNEPTT